LKAEVYTKEHRTLEELKRHVTEEVTAIDKGLLQAVTVISGHCYENVFACKGDQ
jgi:hypothetical protein